MSSTRNPNENIRVLQGTRPDPDGSDEDDPEPMLGPNFMVVCFLQGLIMGVWGSGFFIGFLGLNGV